MLRLFLHSLLVSNLYIGIFACHLPLMLVMPSKGKNSKGSLFLGLMAAGLATVCNIV